MEQTQGMGGSEEGHRIRAEIKALRGRYNFLEGAFSQMTNFIIDLKDKLDSGGGSATAPTLPPGNFASRLDLETHMHAAGVSLAGFYQEMKGAPLEFDGHSFQGLDLCVAWAWTNMPKTTYQCIPVQRLPMQLAAVELVNTAVPSILEGPKTSVLKDPKYNFGAMKTFAEWKPTNCQGSTSAWLKEGLEGAWQQIGGGDRPVLGQKPGSNGGHARDACRIQDLHLRDLHHEAHALLQ